MLPISEGVATAEGQLPHCQGCVDHRCCLEDCADLLQQGTRGSRWRRALDAERMSAVGPPAGSGRRARTCIAEMAVLDRA
jgi:hypothetical protein